MSWRTDTDHIIAESGSKTVIIKSASFNHNTIPPTETSTTVRTATTVFIYPNSGDFKKENKGQIIESTHTMYVSDTCVADVGHRIYESATATDYYEILNKKVNKDDVENAVDVAKSVEGVSSVANHMSIKK